MLQQLLLARPKEEQTFSCRIFLQKVIRYQIHFNVFTVKLFFLLKRAWVHIFGYFANSGKSASNVLLSVPDDACKELKKLQEEIKPRYFWVSLRGNSGPNPILANQILDSFKKDLDFEIVNFDN